jgi:hypothetical protein
MNSDKCLIVFIKYPQAGRVKTRLAQTHGRSLAAGLYRAFVFDVLAGPAKGDYRLCIFFTPPEKEARIRKLLGDSYEYRPQQGADLGERMKNAFAVCFSEGFKSAVLIGSDCPDLPRQRIHDAFAWLEGPCDAVIGPAADGGYYLVGFKNDTFLPDAFHGPHWGGPSVLRQTTDLLLAAGRRVGRLEPWRDIDTGEDLADLVDRSRGTPFARSRTMAYLRKKGICPMTT